MLIFCNRRNDVLYDIIDGYTGEYLTFSKVTGITDSDCDDVIFWKYEGEYFKRNYFGAINVKWYGAVGDNVTNDTDAIQTAIDKCPEDGIVAIYEGMVCNVNTLILKSNMTFVCYGTLNQVTADNLEVFNSSTLQSSSYPLIKGENISNVKIEINKAYSNYEAVSLIHCSDIKISNSFLDGQHAPASFPGIGMFENDHIIITNNEILNFGEIRTSVAVAVPGTGIRALTVDYLTIENNKIHDNGDNGIFILSSKYVIAESNEIYNNCLSGIQVAFDGRNREYDIQFRNNKIYHNMADSIDINNASSGTDIVDIKTIISGNVCWDNGFLFDSTPTNDGSGIATLIRVSNVLVENNTSMECNLGAIFISACGSIIAKNNKSDKYAKFSGAFDNVELLNNTLIDIRLDTDVIGNYLNIQNNTVENIVLPDGISVELLIIRENEITACNLFFSLTGCVNVINNRTASPSTGSSFNIASISNGLLIEGNLIDHTSNVDCISLATTAINVRIINNKITSVNHLIADQGSPYLVVEANKLTAVSGGSVSKTYYGYPSNALLRNNTHIGLVAGSNIVVVTGTLFIDRDQLVSGFPNYGSVTVKNASYL